MTNSINATTFILGSKEVKAKVQIAIGEKVSDTGKVSPVYASFSIPQSPTLPIVDINSAMKRLSQIPAINVSVPQEKDGKVNLQLRPTMAGIRLAVLVCFLREIDYKPLGISDNEVNEHLAACGIKSNVKSKSKSKSKQVDATQADATQGGRETVLADAMNGVPA